jgi:multidrug efflux pump subunit AcrA (membrane-fusion protein)
MRMGQSPLAPARDTGQLRQTAVGLLVVCSIVLTLTGCGKAAAPTPQPAVSEPPPAAPGGTDIVSASGIVVPYREAVLNIRASGRLEEILVSEGQ